MLSWTVSPFWRMVLSCGLPVVYGMFQSEHKSTKLNPMPVPRAVGGFEGVGSSPGSNKLTLGEPFSTCASIDTGWSAGQGDHSDIPGRCMHALVFEPFGGVLKAGAVASHTAAALMLKLFGCQDLARSYAS
jgi:hypothetical protein